MATEQEKQTAANEVLTKHIENLLFIKAELEDQISERQARLEEINKKIHENTQTHTKHPNTHTAKWARDPTGVA